MTVKRDRVLAGLRALAGGIQKNISRHPTTTIADKTYTGPQLLARVNVSVDSAARVQAAWTALAGALADDKRVRTLEGPFLDAVRANVQLMWSNDTTRLAQYGLEPPKKRGALTTDKELVRIAKLRSTREKRQTKGKRQKAAIRGDVAGVVITPTVRGGKGKGGAGGDGGDD
jgi:hypothetical protein